MIEFLKKGKKLNGVHMGMSIDDVHTLLGNPDEIIGDDNNGYLIYKEYRYGYNDSGLIYELSIEFSRLEDKYKFKNLKSEKYGVVFHQSFSISSKTKIHKFIKFLNHLQLDWKADSNSDKDNFIIKITSGPFVVFDLHDGTPFRISVIDGHQ
jgi:hypothetical protein